MRAGHTKAVMLLIVTALLWSTGGVLIKLVTWNPMAIAGMRSAIAFVFIVAFARGRHVNWSRIQVGGALCYCATLCLFVCATKWTTSANAIVLQYISPVYVALLSYWFLKERISKIDKITLVVVIGGMCLFFVDKLTFHGLWGNIFAVASGFTYALMSLFLRKQKNASPLGSVILGNLLTALVGLPFMLQSMPDALSWAGLAALGTFQIGLSYFLYSSAIRHVTALEANFIVMIEPFLNPLWVFLIIGEAPGRWALSGACIVIAAIGVRFFLAEKGEPMAG